MKKFHIVFLEKDTDTISIGKHYLATDNIGAILKFNNEFPNAVFLYIASEEMFDCRFLTK